MAILSITPGITGLAGVNPSYYLIDTSDSVATITTAGYLNSARAEGFVFSNKNAALVATLTAGVESTSWYKVVVTGAAGDYVYSLVAI
jgi:hypothetical protein